jgi:NADPH:quinone reductase-like Zn-dependent oxidoreductase
LAEGGTLIHYGALSGEACQVTHHILSSREIRLVGFNHARALARCVPESRKQLYDQLGAWVGTGRVKARIAAVYPIEKAIEAYERAQSLGDKRFGKVVLRFRDWPRPAPPVATETAAPPVSDSAPEVASAPSSSMA